MPRNASAWLKTQRFILTRMLRAASGDIVGSRRGTMAQRLIGDIGAHPERAAHNIDLSIIREALGTKWATYTDSIHSITVRIIERHLGDAHRYTRQGDRYLLSFDDTPAHVAHDHIRAISTALASYLFGHGASGLRLDNSEADRKRIFVFSNMNRPAIAEHLKRVIASARMTLLEVLALRDTISRRSVWIGGAAEPRIFRGERSEQELGPVFLSPSQPISADRIAPSRAALAQPAFHPAANDDSITIPPYSGISWTPSPRIAADFTSPSQRASDIDLDETTALEHAMKAAVERLARDSEFSADEPPYRRVKW